MAKKKRTKSSPVAKKTTKRTTKKAAKRTTKAKTRYTNPELILPPGGNDKRAREALRRLLNVRRPASGKLGTLIRNKRVKRQMTQKQLAEEVGCRHGWISAIECDGGQPSAFMAAALFKALRIRGAEKADLLREYPRLDPKRLRSTVRV